MSPLRRSAVVACLLLAAPSLRAQQPPTPEQARRAVESHPDPGSGAAQALAARLRRGIAASGLTPDQVRARLRASGYPERLLDAYLRPPRSARDSLTAPSGEALDAIAALGVIDSVDAPASREGRPTDAAGGVSDGVADSASAPGDPDAAGADSLPRLARGGGAARRVAVDTGQTIFGLNVFAAATTQFDPNLAGPVDAGYRLGPGDRLVLIVTGDAERAYTLDVTREGFVVIPGVGQVPVANLTLGQLDGLLYQRLGRVYSGLRRGPGATTRFSLNVARLRSNQVYVLGDVARPGSYRVSSAGTALTALYAAGGPTRSGGMRRVEVRRGGALVDTLDLYDYFLRADGSHDPRLQSGDVVFVPVHGPRARVHGEVVRPATYELRVGETLADLLRAAGGLTAEAVSRRVQVARVLPPGERNGTDQARIMIDVAAESAAAFVVRPGDVVRAFPVSERVARRLAVRGHVWSPGVIGFVPGMRLSDALRAAGGLKADAYLGQVLVSRLRPGDSTRVQLRTALDERSARPVEDLALREDDEVRVFSVGDLRPPAHVAITGAVRRPGRYAYSEGMTLRDLVLIAGGLGGRAYLDEAEIAVPPASRDGGRLAVSRRVPLDSTYLLAPDRARDDGAASSRGAPEVRLEPFANVLIFAQPDWERARRVVLTGEVRFPGTYTLLSKEERLSDVLRRAGGPTRAAHAEGIAFHRAQGDVGRIGVNLARALRAPASRDDLLMQDGDSVHLSAYAPVVEVQGAVNAPRAVTWVPGADLAHYVRAAGGATRLGDVKRAYVTQPDGSVESVVARRLWPDAVPVPRAGSVVYVTQREQPDRVDTVQRLAVVAQVVGGLVTLAAILSRR